MTRDGFARQNAAWAALAAGVVTLAGLAVIWAVASGQLQGIGL